ncbi:MAG: RagB/SusD family nutrient uptake outer membrane protein [Chloroflexia bacterium]|nr:RagB/SusD family nutrient uptake outer membrane protein [Chloroflexia bacterium]
MKQLIYITILSLALFNACTKSFLDTEPLTDVPKDEAITTLRLANAAIYGVYDGFSGGSYYGKDMAHVPDMMGDHILGAVSYSGVYASQYKYSVTADDGTSEGIWITCYNIIDKCNSIIEQIDGLDENDNTGSPENAGIEFDKYSVKAQAYTARAWVYFDLVRLYGKAFTNDPNSPAVPLVIESPKDLLNYKPAKSSVSDVYNQIISDLTVALETFNLTEEKYQYPGVYYMDKGVCEGLLARVYLTMNNMPKAAEHAINVINTSPYSLVDAANDQAAFASMWREESGNEIMWAIANSIDDNTSQMFNVYVGRWDPVVPKPDFVPATKILNLYDQANDARYSTYFKDGVYTLNGWVGTLIYKYDDIDGLSYSFKPMRLAEMYLIAAEALVNSDPAQARTYLNILRSYRINGYVYDNTISGADLANAIWNERVKELFAEGQYMFDIKRLNKSIQREEQPNTQYNTLSVNGFSDKLVFPIPTSEVNTNPNL